jgi:hypothetical protein
MDDAFEYLSETIEIALKQGHFPVESKLAISGAIGYAVERGDLTLDQARRLDAMMGGIHEQYAEALRIATFGATEPVL